MHGVLALLRALCGVRALSGAAIMYGPVFNRV